MTVSGARGRVRRSMVGALLALAGAVPSSVGAQTFTGMVAEQLSLAPAREAVVVLYRVVGDELESVGITATDAEGAFTLAVPGPGTYRVQADLDGQSTPLSQAVEVTRSDQVEEIALLLPSALLRMAMSCQDAGPARGGYAAVVGTVRDPGADVALPGVMVVATWREGPVERRLETLSDPSGQYVLCPPAGVGDTRISRDRKSVV